MTPRTSMPTATPTDAATEPADPWTPTRYTVRVVRRETGDVFTLGLARADGGEVMAFAPGQFNMLYAFGVGESAISIAGDPHRRDLLWHTIRNVGAVTGQLARLRRGDEVLLRGPFGTPWPIDALAGRDIVVVAGGIGLPPLRPALLHFERHRRRYGRIALLYGARTPADLLFAGDLIRWQGRAGFQVELTVDHAPPGTAPSGHRAPWQGDVGVVTTLARRVEVDPARTSVMMCGPEVMMLFTQQAFAARGVPDSQIYVTMERNMRCAIGHCGHCQLGPKFMCKDGPVFPYANIAWLFGKKEL